MTDNNADMSSWQCLDHFSPTSAWFSSSAPLSAFCSSSTSLFVPTNLSGGKYKFSLYHDLLIHQINSGGIPIWMLSSNLSTLKIIFMKRRSRELRVIMMWTTFCMATKQDVKWRRKSYLQKRTKLAARLCRTFCTDLAWYSFNLSILLSCNTICRRRMISCSCCRGLVFTILIWKFRSLETRQNCTKRTPMLGKGWIIETN